MTANVITDGFQQAAQEWQAHQRRPNITEGRLTLTFGPKVMPDLAVLQQKLYVLVRLGYLSADQAEALFSVLSSGSFVALPPIPFPGAVTGSLTLYDMFRLSLENRLEGVDDALDTFEGIAHAIMVVVDLVEAVGDTLVDAWNWLFG
jgi:hypothetical protein